MLSIDKDTFKKDYENKFIKLHGKELVEGNNQQKYEALGTLIKDYVANMWIETNKKYKKTLQIIKLLDKDERDALNEYLLDQKIETRVDLVMFIEREF